MGQAVRVATAVLAVCTLARVGVLLLEALAVVRQERYNDLELAELCRAGAARESSKMRAACLSAQKDAASPLLFKAVLLALGTAFSDFSQAASSPTKLLLIALFACSSVFNPVVSFLRALQPEEPAERHVVIVNGAPALTGPKARFRRAVGALRMRKHRHAPVLELEDGDGDCTEPHIVDLGHEKRY